MFSKSHRLHGKRYFAAMCFLLIVLACTRLIIKHLSRRYVIFLNDPKTSISCHYEVKEDALPSLDEESFNPPLDSIFFHETSCQGGLISRQACSVESAARLHTDRQVYVFFSGPVTENMLRNSILGKLQEIPNVHLFRIHIEQMAKGTPLQYIIGNKTIDSSPFCVYHSADIVRTLTLYKWSGVYLDLDVLVVKNLTPLGTNWVTKEDSTQLNTAAFALSNDKLAIQISEDIVREIARTYDPLEWSWNGPGALTRVLNNSCITPFVPEWANYTCAGFQVYEYNYFFPLHYTYFNLYFEAGITLSKSITTTAYAFHMWNQLSQDSIIELDSPYDKLAKEFCPTVYNTYADYFGS